MAQNFMYSVAKIKQKDFIMSTELNGCMVTASLWNKNAVLWIFRDDALNRRPTSPINSYMDGANKLIILNARKCNLFYYRYYYYDPRRHRHH